MASLVAVDYEHDYVLDMWILFVLWVGFLDVNILRNKLLEFKLKFLKPRVVMFRAVLEVLRMKESLLVEVVVIDVIVVIGCSHMRWIGRLWSKEVSEWLA